VIVTKEEETGKSLQPTSDILRNTQQVYFSMYIFIERQRFVLIKKRSYHYYFIHTKINFI